ncbi:MAG TPA: hypothetical protein VKG45_08100 [Actinomycetes bacterium]|nr:hypothetical protein [Actinomycetes bacterium]
MAEQQPGDDRRSESWPAGEDTEQVVPARPPAQQLTPPGGYQERGPALPPLPSLRPAAAPSVPYGQPVPPGFGFRPQLESSAVVALVVAISAWLVCPVLAAIAALAIAGGAKAKIDAAGGALTGLGLVTAARWVAWVHLCILPLGLLGLIFGITLFGSTVR